MKRILVTGADGFIGSHLVEVLAKHSSYEVVGTSKQDCDLRNAEQTKKLLSTVKPDVVVHLAAMLPGASGEDIYDMNVGGTLNLLSAMRRTGTKELIFVSSSNVYGESGAPFAETSATYPTSPYGISKLIGELLCQDFVSRFNFHCLTLRFPGVFGYGRAQGIVFDLCQAAAERSEIRLSSDGSDTLSLLSIQDAVDGIILGLNSLKKGEGGVYNVTSASVSGSALAKDIANYAPGAPEVIFERALPARHLELSNTKAKTVLGFVPSDFSRALQETVRQYTK